MTFRRSPKVHREPPTRPPGLIDDGYLVEPESLDPRTPSTGWEAQRAAAMADRRSHRLAWRLFWICLSAIVIAVVLVLAVADAAGAVVPSPGTTTVHAAVPAPGSAGVSGELSGWATWYDDGVGRYAAMAGFRPGQAPFLATVWRGKRHVQVLVRDACACGFRNGIRTVIDLSPEAFNVLSPGHPAGSDTDPGKLKVRVDIGGRLELPPTDTSALPRHPDDLRMMLEVRGDELYQ